MTIKLLPLDYRIPSWNQNELVERNCPICNLNSSNISYIRPDSLKIKQCKKCNTYYVSPAPTDKQLSSFYSTYDENHRRAADVSSRELSHSYHKLYPFLDIRIQELSSIMNFKDSKILDVGFGRAKFLYSIMKLGAIPYGVELDVKAVKYAKDLGISNIFQGTISDLDVKNKYNLITFNDVLEHSLEPLALLERASILLENKGFLLIWTPNGGVANYEENPTPFRVDLEHLQYLTMQSCIYISNELNLQIMHLETLGFPSLKGIEKPFVKKNIKTQVIKMIKLLPGFSSLNNFRIRISSSKYDNDRSGLSKLFCIMQKT